MDILLVDADGVILKKGAYFSTHLAKKQNIPESIVTEFFKNEYISCQSGESDLKVVIKPYLEKWKWLGSVDDLLMYWFEYDTVVNEPISKQVNALRNKGIKCYMASNNERYRAEHIKKILDAHALLDGYFFSSDSDIKTRKSNPDFFKKLLDKLVVSGEMVSYIDNDQPNLDAANTLGIKTYLFSEDIFNTLKP